MKWTSEFRRKYNREYMREWNRKNPDKARANSRRSYTKNRLQRQKDARAYYANNKEKCLASCRKRKGVPEATRTQPELCEVSGCSRLATRRDHCHDSGKFRGWLCNQHNVGLGLLGDTVAAVEKVLEYLRKNR